LEALEMSKIAVVQTPPVLLDREKTLEKAVTLVGEAAAEGADLVVFPETFIPGYPSWMWRLRPGSDMALTNELLIDNDGHIANRHRKLMPTNPERMVHGFGDGSGLKVIDTPAGRIGTLLCWENYMPLARYALYAQGVEVYIAPTYDSGDAWIGTLQHIAREGRCWVVGSGFVMRVADIPDDFPDKAQLYPDADAWVNPGDSLVIGPDGVTTAGPMRGEIGILFADLDLSAVAVARRSLDVAGHYSRPDILELRLNTKSQKPIALKE
jgi:nitrilase